MNRQDNNIKQNNEMTQHNLNQQLYNTISNLNPNEQFNQNQMNMNYSPNKQFNQNQMNMNYLPNDQFNQNQKPRPDATASPAAMFGRAIVAKMNPTSFDYNINIPPR